MKLVEYRKIAKQVQDDLSAVFAKHGLKMKPCGAKIDEGLGIVRMTIECADVNHKAADGSATTPEAELFKMYATMHCMKPEWLGQSFTLGGKLFAVSGLKARGTKCVLIRREQDGATLVTTPEAVVRAFLAKTAAQNPVAAQAGAR